MSAESFPKPPAEVSPEKLKSLEELQILIEQAENARAELARAVADRADQSRLTELTGRLNKWLSEGQSIQRRLEGDRWPILTAEYFYKDKDGLEKSKTIEIDPAKKMEEALEFYRQSNIDLPPDFAEQMRELWIEQYDNIKDAVVELGFDEVLLVPSNLPPLEELDQKMTKDYNVTAWYAGRGGISEDNKPNRLILLHRDRELADQPALAKTLYLPAQIFLDQKEDLNLSEYLLFQRKIFEETGQHLDEKGWTWLPGAKSGPLVTAAHWYSHDDRLEVHAYEATYHNPNLGCRLSRSFSLKSAKK